MKRQCVDLRTVGVSSALLLLFTGAVPCSDAQSMARDAGPIVQAMAPQEEFSGTVVTVTNVSRYTYVSVDVDGREIWAAAPRFDVRLGDHVIVPPSLPMKDFDSPALGRRFDELCFVSSIAVTGRGEAESAGQLPAGHPSIGSDVPGPHGTPMDLSTMDFSGIETPEGGKTVAEVFARREQLAGQTIKVRGRVVKFTPAIMGKNWVHIKDGTEDGENLSDLTLTTAGKAAVGDVITVEGVLTIDRDFGHGYAYDLLLEDATLD